MEWYFKLGSFCSQTGSCFFSRHREANAKCQRAKRVWKSQRGDCNHFNSFSRRTAAETVQYKLWIVNCSPLAGEKAPEQPDRARPSCSATDDFTSQTEHLLTFPSTGDKKAISHLSEPLFLRKRVSPPNPRELYDYGLVKIIVRNK